MVGSVNSVYANTLRVDRKLRCIFGTHDAMEGLAVLECLPLDEKDSRYTRSFTAGAENSTEMLSFFREYGFVVIRDVFTAAECSSTRQAMWLILESSNPGFKHDDQSTWMNLKSKGSYGLSLRGPSFHPVLVNNRYASQFTSLCPPANIEHLIILLLCAILLTV
jgi:hypothetical protein